METTVEHAAPDGLPVLPASPPDNPSSARPVEELQSTSPALAGPLAFLRLVQLALYIATFSTAYFGLCKCVYYCTMFQRRFPWPDAGCSLWTPDVCRLQDAWRAANLAALIAGLAAGVMMSCGMLNWLVVDLGWGNERPKRWVKQATLGMDGALGILSALSGALVVQRAAFVVVLDDWTANFKSHLIAVGTMLIVCALLDTLALISNTVTILKNPSESAAVPVDTILIRKAFALAREALRPSGRSDYALLSVYALLAFIHVSAACVALAGLTDLAMTRPDYSRSPFPWLALMCATPKYVPPDWCTSPIHAWRAGNAAALVSLTAVGLMVIGTVAAGAVEAGKNGDGGWKVVVRLSPLGYHVTFAALSIVAAWYLIASRHPSEWFTSSFGWAITRMEAIAALLLIAAFLHMALLVVTVWIRFPQRPQYPDTENGVADTDGLVQRRNPSSDE